MNSPQKIKQKLSFKYPYRIELHAHTTPASHCSDISPEEMAKIYSEKGFNGIVVTNHFILNDMQDCSKEEALKRYLADYEETKKAGERLGLSVFLGAELRFTENDNDYMLYGVDKDTLSVCYDFLTEGVEYFRKNVSLPKSVFVQAHPFRNGVTPCAPELLDGVEIFNMHPGHNSRVGLSVRYAKENHIAVKTAGSDFHHKNIGHEAVAALRTKVLPKDSFHLAKILKSGDYLLELGEDALVLP